MRCTETPSPVRIGTALTLSLLIGTVGVIVAAVLAPILADWYREPALGPLLLAQALVLPPLLLRLIPAALLDRSLAYHRSTTIDLVSELAGFVLAFLVILATHSPWGLVLGSLAQQTL